MEDELVCHPTDTKGHPGHESDPEPTPEMPDGWIYRGDGFARPDPDHPTYPAEHFHRRERLDLDFLLNDPHTNQVLDNLFAQFAEPIRLAEHFQDHPNDVSRDQHRAFTFLVSTLASQSVAEAIKTPPSGIPARTYGYYLFNRLMTRIALPWEDATATGAGIGNSAEPVELLFNPTDTTTQVALDPNQFILRFTHATRADRHAYDDLIDATQEALGYAVHRDPSGNVPDHAGDLRVARLRATLGAIHHHKIADRAGLRRMSKEGVRLRRRKGDKLAEQFYGPRGVARFKKEGNQERGSDERGPS